MATFVMAFGLATSIIVMQSGYKQLDVARSTTLASQVLQSEMERLRLMSWAQIETLREAPTNGESGNIDLVSVFTTDVALAARFSARRTITQVIASEMNEIVLSVTWRTIDGREQTRSFRTRYTKDGLYDYYYTIARS